ncbi:MAG: hypothetical protein KGQ89_02240, partial [Verrucomicrobia bacterium]|nr:hypothetical protein [Verrucomicrobiota bacterium]
ILGVWGLAPKEARQSHRLEQKRHRKKTKKSVAFGIQLLPLTIGQPTFTSRSRLQTKPLSHEGPSKPNHPACMHEKNYLNRLTHLPPHSVGCLS